jgi:hypothetical protein
MIPPAVAPPRAPIPAPASRFVNEPPAQPAINMLIKAVPETKPENFLPLSSLMFMLNTLLRQIRRMNQRFVYTHVSNPTHRLKIENENENRLHFSRILNGFLKSEVLTC